MNARQKEGQNSERVASQNRRGFLPSWLLPARRRLPNPDNDRSPHTGAPEASSDHADYAIATNAAQTVGSLVQPLIASEPTLVVTGYQDFLSTLAIILEMRPELANAPPGTIRVVFGTNTDTAHHFKSSRPLAEQARRYFLGRSGLDVSDQADLNAVLSREAIVSGALDLRIFDETRASNLLGRKPGILHVKTYVGHSAAVMGSANFSRGGFEHNVEYADRFVKGSDAYEDRRRESERFWECGRDWNAEALEILDRLLRLVTPEMALARTIHELRSFEPWDVSSNRHTTGRPPAPYQSDLVYEAASTIYEHGFAFVEAPTGAGKTDIGKHLGVVLPEMFEKTVLVPDVSGRHVRRKGGFAIVPTRVVSNWESLSATGFEIVSSSLLSKYEDKDPSALEDIRRKFLHAAACVVDESHTLNSRWLQPSRRAATFEESPVIWLAALSATLLGNLGLDGLLAFHEKRASLFMSPDFTNEMSGIIERERNRRRRAQEELMSPDSVRLDQDANAKLRDAAAPTNGVSSVEAQQEISKSMAPFVCRRERSCVGESRDRGSDQLKYPEIRSTRYDSKLSKRQTEIVSEIVRLARRISDGQIIASPEYHRVSQTELVVHDKARVNVRNFLSYVRASITYARHAWKHESVGQLLRDAERRTARRRSVSEGQLAFDFTTEDKENEARTTPLCAEIQKLLFNRALDTLDEQRAGQMERIVRRHGQVIFLAERTGPLHVFAEMLARRAPNVEVFTAYGPPKSGFQPNVFDSDHVSFKPLKDGAAAQRKFGLREPEARPDATRAVFMTYQMAEGVNLQLASALAMIGITSDNKNMQQGLGRIDRIDSPHPEIHYYTFDLPGVVLPSDEKARQRARHNYIFSGKPLPASDPDFEMLQAGDITEEIIRLKRSPRILRTENFHDAVGLCRLEIDNAVFERVVKAEAQSIWGSDLCLLPGRADTTIFILKGTWPRLGRREDFQPPRLIGVRAREVIRGQVECVNLLRESYENTKRLGRHTQSPSRAQLSDAIDNAVGSLVSLKQWDLRPERTVSLLASLASFLEADADPAREGEDVFGDLTLPALEYLANTWSVLLDPSWIEAKKHVQNMSSTSKRPMRGQAQDQLLSSEIEEIPDYIGSELVLRFFKARDARDLERDRSLMRKALDNASRASEGMGIGIADRVSVIFQGSTN